MIKYNRVSYNKVTQTTANKIRKKNEEHLRRLDKAMELISEVLDDEKIHDYALLDKLHELLSTCLETKTLLRKM